MLKKEELRPFKDKKEMFILKHKDGIFGVIMHCSSLESKPREDTMDYGIPVFLAFHLQALSAVC